MEGDVNGKNDDEGDAIGSDADGDGCDGDGCDGDTTEDGDGDIRSGISGII